MPPKARQTRTASKPKHTTRSTAKATPPNSKTKTESEFLGRGKSAGSKPKTKPKPKPKASSAVLNRTDSFEDVSSFDDQALNNSCTKVSSPSTAPPRRRVILEHSTWEAAVQSLFSLQPEERTVASLQTAYTAYTPEITKICDAVSLMLDLHNPPDLMPNWIAENWDNVITKFNAHHSKTDSRVWDQLQSLHLVYGDASLDPSFTITLSVGFHVLWLWVRMAFRLVQRTKRPFEFTANGQGMQRASIAQLPLALERIAELDKTALLFDRTSTNAVRTYLTYSDVGARELSGKGFAARRALGKATTDEVRDEVHEALVACLHWGKALYIHMEDAAPDLNALLKPGVFPIEAFRPKTMIERDVYSKLEGLDPFKINPAMLPDFKTILQSSFSEEDYEDFLQTQIPLKECCALSVYLDDQFEKCSKDGKWEE